jgi:hypothetical protein
MTVDEYFGSLVRDAFADDLAGRTAEERRQLLDSDRLGEVLSASVSEIAAHLAESLVASTPAMIEERRQVERAVADDVRRFYGEGLDLCEAVLRIASEMGEEFVDLRCAARDEVPVLDWVLAHLQARACRIAEEALVLARAGFGSGAYSRWRTLHEVLVITAFISEHGDNVAVRYVDHLVIERHKQLSAEERAAAALGEPFDGTELARAQDEADLLVHKHGPRFRRDYGWTDDTLAAIGAPTTSSGFQRIADVTDFGHVRDHYRIASSAIHAGPTLVLEPPDADEVGSTLVPGPSLEWIATPAHAVAIALTACTGTIMTSTKSPAAAFILQTMINISDQAGRALLGQEAMRSKTVS